MEDIKSRVLKTLAILMKRLSESCITFGIDGVDNVSITVRARVDLNKDENVLHLEC